MKKKPCLIIVIITLGIFCFLFIGDIKNICSEESKAEKIKYRPLILSVSNIFPEVERPPVQFWHGKHTNALKQEGCKVCHPADEKGNLVYTFPRVRNEKTKKALMDSYHKDCIGCHKKVAQTGKRSGRVVCGECHIRKVKLQELKKIAWPDAGFDYYLHNLHSELAGGECGSCHHTSNMSSCRDCHGKKDEEKILSFRKAAHSSCLKCHLENKTGPSSCEGCHSGIERTREELAQVPHPNINQPEQDLITIKDATMDEVPFYHKEHEGYTTSCRACHHKTMAKCNTCHTLKGSPEGAGIILAFAYHKESSERSCVGCHEEKKSEVSCAGCHHVMGNGLTEASCLNCHRKPSDKASYPLMSTNPDECLPENLPSGIEINVLEKEYQPVKYSHYAHLKKLTDRARENKLAQHFHTNPMTVCSGCHHQSPLEVKRKVPLCSTCHNINRETLGNIPDLYGAYHRQCLGCHREMKVEPTSCTGCHAEKPGIKTSQAHE